MRWHITKLACMIVPEPGWVQDSGTQGQDDHLSFLKNKSLSLPLDTAHSGLFNRASDSKHRAELFDSPLLGRCSVMHYDVDKVYCIALALR